MTSAIRRKGGKLAGGEAGGPGPRRPRAQDVSGRAKPALRIEICILAGGLSRRMGRDKIRIRLGGKTLLKRVSVAAEQCGFKPRIIRDDLVPRCGPLGGIYTALRTTSAEAVLFLACDMPFVGPELLRLVLRSGVDGSSVKSVFARGPGGVGFPILLPKLVLDAVHAAIEAERLSLSSLCGALRSRRVSVPDGLRNQLQNVNTPEDLARARLALRWHG